MKDNKKTPLKLKERQKLWREIQSFPKRKLTSEQLAKDLEEIECRF